jgi:hypothetical protein
MLKPVFGWKEKLTLSQVEWRTESSVDPCEPRQLQDQ